MGSSLSRPAVAAAPPRQNDFADHYHLAGALGTGTYGPVRLAYSVGSQEAVAVKVFDRHRQGIQNMRAMLAMCNSIRAEERALACIGVHPNIVGLREAFFGNRFTYFVIDLCDSSLFTVWSREQDLNEYTYARYFKKMAQALAHIHSVGVVHRNVKQDNFMVGGADGRTVKLIGFGLSAVVMKANGLSKAVGTVPYMAPEMLSIETTYGPPVDVWALGVIVYIAFFGKWPYQSEENAEEEIKRVILEGNVPPSFAPAQRFQQNAVSQIGIRFVKGLLDRNPATRPSAALCLEGGYLNNLHDDQREASETHAPNISLLPLLMEAARSGAFDRHH